MKELGEEHLPGKKGEQISARVKLHHQVETLVVLEGIVQVRNPFAV